MRTWPKRWGPRPAGDPSAGKPTGRRSIMPSAAVLVGTALLFTGLTAAAMTITAGEGRRPPVATRAVGIQTTPPPPLRQDRAPAQTPGSAAPPSTSAPISPTTAPAVVAPPVVVQIPAIRVNAKVDPMGLTSDGRLAVPTKFERVGWWFGGPKPGEQGSSVLEGHVDSTKGPAVFYALGVLRAGDEIRVIRGDLTTAVFVVERLGTYSKDDFPISDVYGPTETPSLRLITCAGTFNRKRRSYRDNLVVFAHLKP